MKLTGFPLLVFLNVLIASAAAAAIRPHYGGILHVQMESAVSSLDPVDSDQRDMLAAGNVFALMFDTLVRLNDRGEPQPGLATSWQAEAGNQRWQFMLRPGTRFSDATPLTPEVVAASLRRANPGWKVLPGETTVVIQLDAASPDLPSELALPRNSIAKLDGARAVGTGPFVVSQWDPGKKLVVTARDDYWGSRPFLDSVEIDMGRSLRDATIAYDLGQSQVIEIPAEQAQHSPQARPARESEPVELVALLFAHDIQSPEDAKQRQALALSIDRNLLNRVILQGGGEPAGGLLPDWLTGYGFLFPASANLTRAQQLRAEVPQTTLWNLGFDVSDPLLRVLAERTILNASDAGLRLQLANQNTPDIRLIRVPLVSLDAHVALAHITRDLGLPPPQFLDNSVDGLYHAESAILHSQRVIPLLHLRRAWAVSKSVSNWEDARDGAWRLTDVWLATGKP
jgi:ABC-type transport system substrate-binding protein